MLFEQRCVPSEWTGGETDALGDTPGVGSEIEDEVVSQGSRVPGLVLYLIQPCAAFFPSDSFLQESATLARLLESCRVEVSNRAQLLFVTACSFSLSPGLSTAPPYAEHSLLNPPPSPSITMIPM